MPQPEVSATGTRSEVDTEPLDDEKVGAGLALLDTAGPTKVSGADRARKIARSVLPPIVAIAILIGIWQALWAAAFWQEYQLPAPKAVGAQLWQLLTTGQM